MTDPELLAPLEQQKLPAPRNGRNGHGGRANRSLELPPSPGAAHPSLRTYWNLLLKHRGELLTCVAVVVTLVAIYSFKQKPVYRATGRVEIEAEAPESQLLREIVQSAPTDESFLRTQVQVLESDTLAWQVIEQLGLARQPEFADSLRGTRSSDNAAQTLLIRAFNKRLNVSLAPESRIVEVNFESTDPTLAAQVVNALVSDYVEYNFHMKYDATRQASGWMEQQLDELKAKVEKSQQTLVDYERQNAIVNVNDKQNVAEQRLEDLSKDLTVAENDLSQKQSLYDIANSNQAEVAFIAQDELLQKLEEKYADLKAQYVDTLAQYGPNFPRVLRLSDEVAEIQKLINRERQRTVERIGSDYQAALGRERLLQAAVVRQKAEVGDLDQLLIRHNILKRDFETNQQLYETLLQRLKDATVTAGLRATNIHVIDAARVPTLPVRPKKLLNLAIGVFVGLLAGTGLAFVEEGLDCSLRSVEEVEDLLGAPSLAVIPLAGSDRSRRYSPAKPSSNGHRNATVALAVLKDPISPLAESYRSLRTSILLSAAPRPPQVLLLTSAQPSEGKTSTSVNLSLALAQRGSRVLLIDADMRKPGVAHALGLPNEKGLSGILTGAHSFEAALCQLEAAPSLSVLTSGPIPPNPADLLSSPSMAALLADLRPRFDHVVLDSPPDLLVADAVILSSLADGVVLVLECGATSRGALMRAHGMLESAGGRVLGVVVNKVDFRQNHDGYYLRYRSYYRAYSGDVQPQNSQS